LKAESLIIQGKFKKAFLLNLTNWMCLFDFRFKDEPEPDHDPPKLFRVTRTKPMKGQPHWERRILRDMGLYEVILVSLCLKFSLNYFKKCQ
jgi:hypothetical protein